MQMREGQRWHCTNQGCHGEILVTGAARTERQMNPRCICGGVMKKPYTAPLAKSVGAPAAIRRFLGRTVPWPA